MLQLWVKLHFRCLSQCHLYLGIEFDQRVLCKPGRKRDTAKLLFDQQEYLGCIYSSFVLTAKADSLPGHQWEYANTHCVYDWLEWSGKFPTKELVCLLRPTEWCLMGFLWSCVLHFAHHQHVTYANNKNNNSCLVAASENWMHQAATNMTFV